MLCPSSDKMTTHYEIQEESESGYFSFAPKYKSLAEAKLVLKCYEGDVAYNKFRHRIIQVDTQTTTKVLDEVPNE